MTTRVMNRMKIYHQCLMCFFSFSWGHLIEPLLTSQWLAYLQKTLINIFVWQNSIGTIPINCSMPTPSNDAMLAGLVMNLNDYISSFNKYNGFFTPGIRDNFTDALHESALSLGQACAGFISLRRFVPRLAQYNKIGKRSSRSTSIFFCLQILIKCEKKTFTKRTWTLSSNSFSVFCSIISWLTICRDSSLYSKGISSTEFSIGLGLNTKPRQTWEWRIASMRVCLIMTAPNDWDRIESCFTKSFNSRWNAYVYWFN